MIEKRELKSDKIEKKISDILDTLEIIRENLPESAESLGALGLIKDGLYKKVEFAIESLIDICSIINVGLRLGVPETEDGLISNIEKNKVLDEKAVQIIKEMKRFRNVLVHKYGDIDDVKAYNSISSGLDDFEAVITEIEKFLERHKKSDNEKLKKQPSKVHKKT